MSAPPTRTKRLRDILGAAIVAVGVSVTLTAADARAAYSPSKTTAPLAARLREARDSLNRLHPPDADAADPSGAARDGREPGAMRWANYWVNAIVVPWRNWNNWNNWHNFNQWVNA
jgi:hypothetical protein